MDLTKVGSGFGKNGTESATLVLTIDILYKGCSLV